MGLKRKEALMRQKSSFENQLQHRLSFLSGKGIDSSKAGKDTLVRGLQADIRAVNRRLRLIADGEKRTTEAASKKAERAAALPKEEQVSKGEKPKKGTGEGKGKKAKAETKAVPAKAPDGGKSQKTKS
jgi:hypothetical protein